MPQAQDTAHKNACRECQYEEPTGGGHCHQNKDHKPDREDQPRDAFDGNSAAHQFRALFPLHRHVPPRAR